MENCDRPSHLTDPVVSSSRIIWVSLTNQEAMVQPSKTKYTKEFIIIKQLLNLQ
jgi:hypothetical protein